MSPVFRRDDAGYVLFPTEDCAATIAARWPGGPLLLSDQAMRDLVGLLEAEGSRWFPDEWPMAAKGRVLRHILEHDIAATEYGRPLPRWVAVTSDGARILTPRPRRLRR